MTVSTNRPFNFDNASAENRWHYGAVGGYYDLADNCVWAAVEKRDSAAEDFELLLMQLRERFAGVDPGEPKWDEIDEYWVYRITVDLGEDYAARRRSTLAWLGSPEGEHHEFATADLVLDHETGTAYVVTDYIAADGDWAAVCGVLLSSGWFTGDPAHDDMGAPFFNPATGTQHWTITR